MQEQSLLHTIKRYKTLLSHKITVLPIAILMPHSACNCMCVMCDIWKGNKNAQQLKEDDIMNLMSTFKKLDTKRIIMSGGEALLNKNFFKFCEIIRKQNIKITLLSTGVTLEHHAQQIVDLVDEVIVSLDGDEKLHNEIRNLPSAFDKLKKGVQKIKSLNSNYLISGRSVIHNLNYKRWTKIIDAAKELSLNSISFLPADVTSQAFNREQPWQVTKQENLLIPKSELSSFKLILDELCIKYADDFSSKYILESPDKLNKIYQYYLAQQGMEAFPIKKCNAPWVSVVVEADGKVRPCFFHDTIGDIRSNELSNIINSPSTIEYRKQLDINKNTTCEKCVCYLNLSPRNNYY